MKLNTTKVSVPVSIINQNKTKNPSGIKYSSNKLIASNKNGVRKMEVLI